MSVNGDVSEQVVRLSLEGFEVLARLTGSGAKNVAAMIYTIMKDQQQTKGKTKLNFTFSSICSMKLNSLINIPPEYILSLLLCNISSKKSTDKKQKWEFYNPHFFS